MRANRVVGVDLGGTKILAGVIEDGQVLQTVEHPTPTTSQDALLDGLAAAVKPLRDVPFLDAMGKRLDLPVAMENDATCAAYAEYVHGVGQGTDNFVMLTLGTGVGGGVVVDGSLFRAWTELGHMVIVEDGVPCQGACSGRGHVEGYCSGTAVNRLARETLGPDATARDLVEQHHPVLATVGHHLGVTIGSLVNIFGAERFAIGGGFGVAAFDQLVPAARSAVLREALPTSGQDAQIERAVLGAEAGLIGAGLVALEAL
jgi:glucokinase